MCSVPDLIENTRLDEAESEERQRFSTKKKVIVRFIIHRLVATDIKMLDSEAERGVGPAKEATRSFHFSNVRNCTFELQGCDVEADSYLGICRRMLEVDKFKSSSMKEKKSTGSNAVVLSNLIG